MVVITLVKDDENQIINPDFEYKSPNSDHLECIKFDPPLKTGRTTVEFIYFQHFKLGKLYLSIYPQGFDLEIPNNLDSLQIKFVIPRKTLEF